MTDDDATSDIYPWYRVTDGESLEQGDLLAQFPLLLMLPPYEPIIASDRANSRRREFDVVILSQSCDLEAGKIDNVLVCPMFLPDELSAVFQEVNSARGRNRIKQGSIPSMHMLPPGDHPGFESPPPIVNFRQVAAVPLGLILAQVRVSGPRLRLLPPYREHLAQAFARFIMRVGFPHDFTVE